ncbi:MAG: hypothetical protein IPM63_13045 [Acidobacteriota bacterium]|nr:MAG: hypothetical protein IPM63_13045 [Acidobacteriota bacterium]
MPTPSKELLSSAEQKDHHREPRENIKESQRKGRQGRNGLMAVSHVQRFWVHRILGDVEQKEQAISSFATLATFAFNHPKLSVCGNGVDNSVEIEIRKHA